MHPTGTRLIDALPARDREAIIQRSRRFAFMAGDVLHDVDQVFVDFIFLERGIVAAMVMLEEGQIETGLIGSEGVVPTLVAPVHRSAHRRFLALTEGRGRRIAMSDLERLLTQFPTLRAVLDRRAAAVHRRDHLAIACAALHGARPRLARMLLRLARRMDQDHLFLTQDTLAHLLGVRRTTVNEVAGELQLAGAIRYRRGRIAVLDRAMLERFSCGCGADEVGLCDPPHAAAEQAPTCPDLRGHRRPHDDAHQHVAGPR